MFVLPPEVGVPEIGCIGVGTFTFVGVVGAPEDIGIG